MTDWWFFRFLDWSRRTPWMMAWVLVACFAIGGWGFYAYYGPQFEWVGLEHWYVWPFVPDCPLFVYLFALVMVGMYVGIQHPAFTAFVALGNIKFGAWTVFVLVYYSERFFGDGGGQAWFRGIILALHVGMVPLGLLLWRTLPRLKVSWIGGILGASLLFDYMDYFFTRDYQIYPVGLPNHGRSGDTVIPYEWQDLGLVPWFTIGETLVLTFALYWLNAANAPRAARSPGAGAEPAIRP